MKIKEIIGIDVSKETIDTVIHTSQLHSTFDTNSANDIKKMTAWVRKHTDCPNHEVLFVFEHTGLYSHQLATTLSALGLPYTMVPGLAIKRSLGIVRGKNDRIDAAHIALYGYRLREELAPSHLPSTQLQSLKRLLGLRKRLVKQRAGFKSSFKEQQRVLKVTENEVFFEVQRSMIRELSTHIARLEREIHAIIKGNKELYTMYRLITSINGVGPQTALYMIVSTEGFTKFKTWRKFACYCGIAPFPNSSGTSLRGKTKVSHLANKELKALLSSCATCALQYNPEMKQYYERRIKQGKSTMSTILT